nr:glycosyltransferase [Variovorax boronicumulans]
MALPRFLVILAAFNGAGCLREQVHSILGQRDVEVHLVISVDRSSDGTEALVEALVREDSRVSALPFFEVFGGAAPNFFRLLGEVDLAACDYLSFSDQDDVWLPDKLVRAHQELARTGCSGYSSNVIATWPSGKERLIRKDQPQRRWDHLFEGPGPGCTFVLTPALALACRVRIQAQAHLVGRIGFHDWLIYALARAQGFAWHIDGRPGMFYRQHGSNQVGANAGLRSWLKRVASIASGWGFRQASLIARVAGMESEPFVSMWIGGQRIGLVKLALQCGQCRRRPQDRILFALSCLLMAVHLPQRGLA